MTTRTFLDGKITLHCGDCLDVLAALPENSVDSIVCDPPYALTSGKSAKSGFMSKSWDTGEVAFDPAFWSDALRVLRPGGHCVAFSGTRTYHHMASAIEAAGFEIRDQLGYASDTEGTSAAFLSSLNDEQLRAFTRMMDDQSATGMGVWVYGSGMPKVG